MKTRKTLIQTAKEHYICLVSTRRFFEIEAEIIIMDGRLYRAAKYGDQNFFRELTPSNASVLLQLTCQRDTILHVAAKFEQMEIAEMIMNMEPSLVYQKNSKGDTPLHIAARIGTPDMMEVLINYGCTERLELEANERLVRMVNMENDTAFHEAARKGHFEAVELLIQKDPELVMFTNNAGESPLFLAVDNKHLRIASYILEAAPICSFQGRNNMNALHAAVIRSSLDAAKIILSARLKNWNPLFYLSNYSFKDSFKFTNYSMKWATNFNLHIYNQFDIAFIKQLMEKCTPAISEVDNFGWTPLHYAAQLGEKDIVEELLLANNSVAYIKNEEGLTALHVAAKEGHVAVLLEIVAACPDIWDLQDNKGQTAVHVAVENNKVQVVKFILELVSEDLLNQQDNEGNTPLHLATFRGYHKILELLVNDKRVDKTIMNKEGLAVMDIIQSNRELRYYGKAWMTLHIANAGGLSSLEGVLKNSGRKTTETSEFQQSQAQQTRRAAIDGDEELAELSIDPAREGNLSYNHLRDIASINLLVTTLIATVSFAAAFTMPGGYRGDGPDEGMAILSKRKSFKAFVVANTLAFCFSSVSMFLHYFTSLVGKRDLLAYTANFTVTLTGYAITAMVIAFISGSYAVLADSTGLAIAVLSIGCSYFVLQGLAVMK